MQKPAPPASRRASVAAPSRDRITEIDRLRAYAIFLVVVSHLHLTILADFIPAWLGQGWTGVDLFFVISGFVVSRSFADWLARGTGNASLGTRARLARTYFFRRMTRILPAAWLWAVIPFLLALTFNASGSLGHPGLVFREMLAVFLFFYNYFTSTTDLGMLGQFWSLAVEEQFYFFLPFFLVCVRNRNRQVQGLALLLALAFFLRLHDWQAGGRPNAYFTYQTQYRLDGLVLGSMLGLSADAIRRFRQAWKWSPVEILLFKVATVLLGLGIWILPGFADRDFLVRFGYALLALASGFLVLFASLERGLIPGFGPLGKYIDAIGRRSYSIYLTHFPLMCLILELRFRVFGTSGFGAATPWPSPAAACLGLVVYLILLAIVVELNYRWIELPLLGLAKRKFRPN